MAPRKRSASTSADNTPAEKLRAVETTETTQSKVATRSSSRVRSVPKKYRTEVETQSPEPRAVTLHPDLTNDGQSKRGRPWTFEESAKLATWSVTMTRGDIGDILGRSDLACRLHLHHLKAGNLGYSYLKCRLLSEEKDFSAKLDGVDPMVKIWLLIVTKETRIKHMRERIAAEDAKTFKRSSRKILPLPLKRRRRGRAAVRKIRDTPHSTRSSINLLTALSGGASSPERKSGIQVTTSWRAINSSEEEQDDEDTAVATTQSTSLAVQHTTSSASPTDSAPLDEQKVDAAKSMVLLSRSGRRAGSEAPPEDIAAARALVLMMNIEAPTYARATSSRRSDIHGMVN